MYDALHKRTLYLDAIGKGLDVFGIKKMISVFPEICKPAFVNDGKLLPSDVLSKLKPVNQPVADLSSAELTVAVPSFLFGRSN